MRIYTLLLLFLFTLLNTSTANACTYDLASNGNKSNTRFFDNGKFFVCTHGLNRQKQLLIKIIEPFAQTERIVTIQGLNEEENTNILALSKNNTFALIETYKLTKPTKKNPSSSVISRYFRLDFITGNTRQLSLPNYDDSCHVFGARLVNDDSMIAYIVSGNIKEYLPEERRWSISGCEESVGVYTLQLSNQSIKRISNTPNSTIISISPSGRSISHLSQLNQPNEKTLYGEIISRLNTNEKAIDLVELIKSHTSKQLSKNITTARVGAFLNDEEIIGVYYEGPIDKLERSVLFKLSLSKNTFTTLDSLELSTGTNGFFIESVSPDMKYVSYKFYNPDGGELRAIALDKGKPLFIGKATDIQGKVQWSDSGISFSDNEALKYTDIGTKKSRFYELYSSNLHDAIQQSKENAKVPSFQNALDQAPVAHVKVNDESMEIIGNNLLYIAGTSKHFCDQYLFSTPVTGGVATTLSQPVVPETCGAIHLSKTDNENEVIYLINDEPNKNFVFMIREVDGSKPARELYRIKSP